MRSSAAAAHDILASLLLGQRPYALLVRCLDPVGALEMEPALSQEHSLSRPRLLLGGTDAGAHLLGSSSLLDGEHAWLQQVDTIVTSPAGRILQNIVTIGGTRKI
jgi:hypothetical protein